MAIYAEDVGAEGVMSALTPITASSSSSAVLERFLQLALDGAWILTDREA